MILTWRRIWAPKRHRYADTTGRYEIRWYGSTHGVWQVTGPDGWNQVRSLLSDAKADAQTHADAQVQDARRS